MGGEDQDVRTAAHRLLHGDDVGAGAAALVGVGLAGDGVAHLLKAPGNIVRGVRLPLRSDGPGLGGEDLQVLPDARHVRQVAGALEHGHRLGHCDGVPRGQGVRGLTVHEPRLDAPGQGLFRPGGHLPPVAVGPQVTGQRRGAGLPVEDGGKGLALYRRIRGKGAVPLAVDISLLRRPGDGGGSVAGDIGEGAVPIHRRAPGGLIEELRRIRPGHGLPRRGEIRLADGYFPGPVQGLLAPGGPVRGANRQGLRDDQGKAQRQSA